MLADFYIRRLSNNIKTAVQKNNLVGQIWYRSVEPVKNGVIVKFCTNIMATITMDDRNRKTYFGHWTQLMMMEM